MRTATATKTNRGEKVGITMEPSTAKNVKRTDKKKWATTTSERKHKKKKKKPREESCGVVKLVQAILVLTCMYKLIICVVCDVHTITTLI